jgi:hypothetical protein
VNVRDCRVEGDYARPDLPLAGCPSLEATSGAPRGVRVSVRHSRHPRSLEEE